MFAIGGRDLKLQPNDSEVLTKDRLISMWTNFAATG